ncbi:HEPN domain-containing protein [Paracoccus sp. (in: a-proteobacteria)]
MPSAAKKLFFGKLVIGVEKLVDSHHELNPAGRGRRNLTHLTHGGVLMLCAAWELYVEDALREAVGKLIENESDPNKLPDRVKRKIAAAAKNDKHDWGVLRLANNGWKEVYLDAVNADCDALNTPKFGSIATLYQNWLDVSHNELAAAWRSDRDDINAFVTLRGDIAHRGSGAAYVRRDDLCQYIDIIKNTVIDTDNFLAHHVRRLSHGIVRCWNVTPVAD